MSLRTLKNGIGVSIREAAPKDAEKMIAFYNRVGGESDFLSFGEGEFLTPLSEYELFLSSVKQEQNSLIVVAEKEEKIIRHPSPPPKTRVISMWGPSVL
ncbi:hypothetical protein [Priestia aryabhattai]|uniref:hypothetical protein n=1 Tax=Priestia aryabhattai TaxID=412384 RepID=UPI001FD84F97|nr:hypothetical protein [Priestia aryabhattai]